MSPVGFDNDPAGEEQVDQDRAGQSERQGLPVDVRVAGVVVVAEQEQLIA